MDKLIAHIEKEWQCTPERYPELAGATPEEYLRFVIRHSALHFAKTAGKVAAVSEDIDHGGELDKESLKINVAKSLINTLYLAGQIGMDEAELTKLVNSIVDPKAI